MTLATIAGQDIELTVSGIGLVELALALASGRRRRFSHISGASRDGDAGVGLAPRGD